MRNFPVLYGYDQGKIREETGFVSVPWEFLAHHEAQAERNHSQTLERLAERGGLSPSEMLAIVDDSHWKPYMGYDTRKAIEKLLAMLKETK